MSWRERALLMLVVGAMLAWRLAALMMRACGVYFVAAGVAELMSGGRLLTSAARLTLGVAGWVAGRRADALRHRAYHDPLFAPLLARHRRWLR